MDNIKATLISVNNGFKIVAEKTFDTGKFPMNNFSEVNAIDGKHPCDHKNELLKEFDYYWLMCLMFPNSIIGNYQSTPTEKGHPDFIVYDRDDPKKKIFVEFKSQKDSLHIPQIKWFIDNPNKEKYILFLENYFNPFANYDVDPKDL